MTYPLERLNVDKSYYGTYLTPDGRAFSKVLLNVNRSGWKQAKPFNLDTPLVLHIGYTPGRYNGLDADTNGYKTYIYDDAVEAGKNKARAKFLSKIGDASQLGSTLTAEFRATYKTVVGGALTALQAARLVKRGDLLGAGKLLGFSPPVIRKRVTLKYKVKKAKRNGNYSFKRKGLVREYWVMPDKKHVLKSLGNRWLWYSYGVRPLIDDLHNASQVFTREVPHTKVRGGGVYNREVTFYSVNDVYKVHAIVQAFLRVNNPNIRLASQLGLLNPIQWFNEGVMFSFVIDWFSNWSDWINQLTDLSGLEIAKPSTFVKVSTTRKIYFGAHRETSEFTDVTRVQSIPKVILRFEYERFQWQRGANAISLLAQFLKSAKT